MRLSRSMLPLLVAVGSVLSLALPTGTVAQHLDRIQNIYPENGLPNPYSSEDGWVNLPDGRTWGSTAGTDIDPDGVHIWAIDRCGSNSCAASDRVP